MSAPELRALVEAAAAPYRASGRFAWHFARGKLGHDPVFPALLRLGLLQTPARVLDVGCGQALLANWIAAAARHARTGPWPVDWPAVAPFTHYQGIDLDRDDIRRGQAALPADARIECADMRSASFAPAERIVMLDVLHYVPPAAQVDVLDRVKAALTPEGTLILRVGDASAGWRAWRSRLTDQVVMFARGRGWQALHCRALAEWVALLESRGLAVEPLPMSSGTAFANTLLIARHAR